MGTSKHKKVVAAKKKSSAAPRELTRDFRYFSIKDLEKATYTAREKSPKAENNSPPISAD